MVFNFPEGDTVALNVQNQSYYALVRAYGRARVWQEKETFGEIVARPVDKRENYIKRCVGIPGDKIELKDGQLYVNGKERQTHFPGMQREYVVTTDGAGLSKRTMEQLGIAEDDRHAISASQYLFPLTQNMVDKLKSMKNIKNGSANQYTCRKLGQRYLSVQRDKYQWNVDNRWSA